MIRKAQVVIQTAFLGDLLLSIPFLQRIKRLFPQDELVLICKKGLGSFLKQQNIIDDFFEIEKGDRQSYRYAKAFLKNIEISNLFCLHRSTRSLLFTAQLKARKKIGFSSIGGFFIFDEVFRYEHKWPDVIRKFKLLSSLDKEVAEALKENSFEKLNSADDSGKLPTPPNLFSFQPKDRIKNLRQVCIFPGSVWATKRWTEEGFTLLAQNLAKEGFSVLLLGGPDEKALCDSVAVKVPSAQVLAGHLSIQQSIEKVGESALVIANDSAATHMAAYQGTPSVTIFGPTVLSLGFRPWSDLARVVQVEGMDCRPCGMHGHKQCPLGHHHCMKWIGSDKVLKIARELLNILKA